MDDRSGLALSEGATCTKGAWMPLVQCAPPASVGDHRLRAESPVSWQKTPLVDHRFFAFRQPTAYRPREEDGDQVFCCTSVWVRHPKAGFAAAEQLTNAKNCHEVGDFARDQRRRENEAPSPGRRADDREPASTPFTALMICGGTDSLQRACGCCEARAAKHARRMLRSAGRQARATDDRVRPRHRKMACTMIPAVRGNKLYPLRVSARIIGRIGR